MISWNPKAGTQARSREPSITERGTEANGTPQSVKSNPMIRNLRVQPKP